MSKNPRRLLHLLLAALVATALLSAACSSDDDTSDATDTTERSSDDSDTDDGGDAGEEGKSSGAFDCTEMFTTEQVEALFGEPAVLEEEDSLSNNDAIGQTTCTWSTVEDESNVDDVAVQLLLLQYYSGDPVSGTSFYDPEVQHPGSEPLDIGDEGFIDTEGGIDIGFVEGDSAGFLSWSSIDLGSETPVDPATKKDQVIALAREFQEKVA